MNSRIIGIVVVFCIGIFGPVMAEDFDAQNAYKNYLKKYDYENALVELEKKKEEDLSVPERKIKMYLQVFRQVEKNKVDTSSVASLDIELTPQEEKELKRFYREAQKAILENKEDIARDILIYILYRNPDDRKSKLLLDKALGYSPGSYKIFNVVDRYFRRAETFFLGGNYLLAIQDLEVLAIIDKDNTEVFKRLGSAKYMIDEKKDAVDAWATALFLDPSSKELEHVIVESKKQLEKEAKERLADKKKAKKEKVVIDDPQVMGVFKRQSQALEMASLYKQKGMKVLIDELDNGKYSVQVSKKELAEKFNKGK